jgi:predicted NBD/HSP70 family sugar kinase
MPHLTFTTRGALQKSALRLANERVVLDAVRRNPGISRTDLVRISGLSASSISFIVGRLKRHRLLIEEPLEAQAQVGRRPTALRLADDARLAVAVDVMAGNSRVALVDLGGRILRQKHVAWQANPDIVCHRLHAAVRSLLQPLRPDQVLGVGVALPATIDSSTGRIIAAENLGWFNVEFGRLLRGDLGLPFYFENNAKLAALAERWFTSPGQPQLQDFAYVTPTGGLGTGIVIDGHLLQGGGGMGGEFGHIALYPDGLPCACGGRGCLEQYVSDAALCRVYAEESGQAQVAAGADTVVRRAREGDAAALAALHRTARDLGLGFTSLLWIFSPEAIVVGGFLADAWDLVKDTVWSTLHGRVPQYLLSAVRIYPSRHAVDAATLGAASLVLSHFFTRFDHANGGGYPVTMHAAR